MDPQIANLLEMLRAATPPDAPRLWQLPVTQARAVGDAFLSSFNGGGPVMVETRDVEALLPWLDWAFAEAKAALPKAA